MSESSSSDSPGAVVFLSGDLIFSSRVSAAAQRAGMEFRLSGALPDSDTESIRYVILDLSTRASLTESIAQDCEARCPSARLIAYGPHVQAGKLAAAKEAGIPTVVTRGQFDAKLSNLFST